jgi:WD40 repeat protein
MSRFTVLAVCLIAVAQTAELPAQDAGRGAPEGKPRLVLNTGGHTAQVRALAFSPDSQRLFSAGLDKIVMTWEVRERSRGRTSIDPDKPLHWELSRGMRGTIMELAAPTNSAQRWLAIGGVSARGQGGDITVYDAAAGQVQRTVSELQGSLATGGLAFSPDGTKLAAVSVLGDLWLWSVPEFTPTQLRPVETREGKARDRPYRALAFLKNDTLAAAIPFGDADGDQWNIALYDLRRADRQPIVLRKEHKGAITAIVRDPNSPRWATADKGGEVFLWTGAAEQVPELLRTTRETLDVAFGPEDSIFLATRLLPQKEVAGAEAAFLEHWKLSPARKVKEIVTSGQLDNYACAVSPDQKWLATCGDDSAPVMVFPLRDAKGEVAALPLAGDPLRLRGAGTALGKVAFAVTAKGEYQVGFGPVEQSGRVQDFNNYGSPQRVFDLTGGRLLPDGEPPPRFRSPHDAERPEDRKWTVTLVQGRRQLVLTHKAGYRCTITLDASTQGEATCYSFLRDEQMTYGLAVGTNHQNGVFVYQLVTRGECPLLRYYRDHNYVVTSLSVSADRQYLASASLDGTIKIWSLDGARSWRNEIEPARRGPFKQTVGWGATFVDRRGNLVAENVAPAGIAFGRGIRTGDILDTLLKVEGGAVREYQGAKEILAALNATTLFEQLTIKVNRQGRIEELPQIVPAWEPVATLFVDRNEWALFTPQGPYQASVNGDRLFGWQFNMGRDATPDFLVAERLRRELERPDVLENLFKSSAAKLIQSQLTELVSTEDYVRRAAIDTPVVLILSPQSGDQFGPEPISIQARVYYPPGEKPADYDVFALLNAGDIGQPLRRSAEPAKLPTELVEWKTSAGEAYNHLSVQVQKKGDPLTEPFDYQFVKFRAEAAAGRPRLHLLLLAADAYAGRGLELPYPVRDADALADALRARSADLYDPGETFRLVNHEISQAGTPAEIERIAATLRTSAHSGDLLVVYIAGHGAVYDDKYYFLPPDEKLLTLGPWDRNLVEQIGLPWESLLPLRETPCRKLVLLDTCHSGNAVLENDSLGHHKAMTRPLRQAEMLIVSATSAGQEARGTAEKGGFFTQALRDGLAGFADGFAGESNQSSNSPDEEVEVLELVRYVTAEVPRRTRTINVHTPMHSPEQLFKTLHIPLTRYDPAALRRAPQAASAAIGGDSD